MDVYRALYNRRLELGRSRKSVCDEIHMNTKLMKQAEEGNARKHGLLKVVEWAEALGLEITVRCKDDRD